MSKYLVLFVTLTTLVALTTPLLAADMQCMARVVKADPNPDGLTMVLEATGPNAAGLGKFFAHVDSSTVITQNIMCQPPRPVPMAKIQVGHVVTVTFDKVYETWPPQVDCLRVSIAGYPFVGPRSQPTAPAGEPTVPASFQAQIKGTISEIMLAKDLAHAGTGRILVNDENGGMIYLIVTKQTSILVPGPTCGPIEGELNGLEVGWTCSATFTGPVLESLPPQVHADVIYAGFRAR